MTTKQTTTKKISAKPKAAPEKSAKPVAQHKPAARSTTVTPARKKIAAATHEAPVEQEPIRGHQPDPSDAARDQRLRNELEDDSRRSASDRHRERLTAVEAEEDGVRDDLDENDDEKKQRELAVGQEEVDEEEP